MNTTKLSARFKRLFKCDSARVVTYGKRSFLIIGHRRNTRQDNGQWCKDGVPIDFDYLSETVVASGDTEKQLLASAREYRRLSKLTMAQYLKKELGRKGVAA